MDILETITFVGSLFIVTYLFIAQPHQIKGQSMDNNFHDKEYIITSKITYKFHPPEKGDVIVFQSPHNPDIDYIKRIIGTPGDRVYIKNEKVYVNGSLVNEPYIEQPTRIFQNGFLSEGQEVIVPENHLFVLGDNRTRSSDSREFGFIRYEDVIGNVIFRYFPLDKLGPISNPQKTMGYLIPSFLVLHS